jgi:hypothetical protein
VKSEPRTAYAAREAEISRREAAVAAAEAAIEAREAAVAERERDALAAWYYAVQQGKKADDALDQAEALIRENLASVAELRSIRAVAERAAASLTAAVIEKAAR